MSAIAFPESPLVAALVTDLASPPRLLCFEGYLGLSSRRDYARRYTDRFLNEFFDFPKASVCHVIALPTGRRWPSGGWAIWVDLGTLEDRRSDLSTTGSTRHRRPSQSRISRGWGGHRAKEETISTPER